MFFNYGAPKGAARNGQMGGGRSQRATTPSKPSTAPKAGTAPKAAPAKKGASSAQATTTQNTRSVSTVAGKIAAKNNADTVATKAEVKSAKTPAERKALTDKLNAQKKAADAAVKVKQAALAGNAKALKDAVAAQKRAEMEKVKAEARARAEAEKAQREAEAKPAIAVTTIVSSKPGESLNALLARANAAASQKLATFPTGVKFPSAKNGRVYEVRSRTSGATSNPYIFITYPEGTTRDVFSTEPSFAVVFADLENAVAVANLRQQTVVETTGSTTGDVVTTQDAVGADAAFVPSGEETVAGSTDGATVVAASDTSLPSGGGTLRVTSDTSTSDYVPSESDGVPGQNDEASVIRASETALATEAQNVVDEAVAATDAAADGTAVSTPDAAASGEESFLVKYKWPLVGVGIALAVWAVKSK